MDRKSFVRTSCLLCIGLSTGVLSVGSLVSCSPLPVFKTTANDHHIRVQLNLFVNSSIQIIRGGNLGYDIALRKEKNGSFTALQMRCTHADNPLDISGNGFVCSLHGSTFNKEGEVTNGPAEIPLQKFKTMITNTDIFINLN